MPRSVHHFALSNELLASSSFNEAQAIMLDMKELNLCRMPYPVCDVSVRPALMIYNRGWFDQDGDPHCPDIGALTYTFFDGCYWVPDTHDPSKELPMFPAVSLVRYSSDTGRVGSIDLNAKHPADPIRQNVTDVLRDIGAYSGMLLVSSLAASNVVKQTSINKRAARGIGNGRFKGHNGTVYISTTTVTPPAFLGGLGTSPRPHLRRGHVHTFLTGAGRVDRLKKFVAPTFVNGGSLVPRKYVVK